MKYTKALFLCHMKINSQNDFTSKTAKINHVRSNSKFQIKSIQHDFIFLSLIWFFLQTLILGLNFNVWQEINCQRKKFKSKISHQIWNFQSRAQTVNFTSLDCWILIKKSNHDQEKRAYVHLQCIHKFSLPKKANGSVWYKMSQSDIFF